MLTPGQVHDLTCAEPLLEGVDPGALIADKAYDADPLRDTLAQRDIDPVIPPKANRKTPPPCDFALYCERNLVERFFNKIKNFVLSPPATTNLRETFSPVFTSPALSSS
jgi:putative transposase